MKPAILLLTITLAAHSQPAAQPKYEVASIKPNTDSDSRVTFQIEPDGTLSATGITLMRLMMTAFNAQNFRIVGGPDWVSSRRWDLQAKPNRATRPDEVRPMLRALLEDRFQLHTRTQIRRRPVYDLTLDRKGPKLRRSDAESERSVRLSVASIRMTKATPATFASQLSYALGRPVIDKTKLTGNFDFTLEWTPEPGDDAGMAFAVQPPGTSDQPAPTPDRPSIFTALPQQLGLRVKSARGPVDVVVIDSVLLPSAN
jgi:uncharacterized protein (TIGR03435 family)